MKLISSTLALIAALGLAGAASAQPSGGPDAKGNAPLKHAHTVNNGDAKPGANSFTEGQARTHIEKSGFTGVSTLVKGADGVWRGQAMRNGQTADVAMDFKGNVSTSAAASPGPVRPRPVETAPAAMMAPQASPRTAPSEPAAVAPRHRAHRRRHRHHVHQRCLAAQRQGAACSGVDKNDNGVSDKEDRMHAARSN